MKFISVRDLRGKSGQVWAQLPEEREMVVTSNGRPVAILSAVGERDVEQALSAIRRARAVAAVTSIQARSARQGASTLTAGEIESEIKAVRGARRVR